MPQLSGILFFIIIAYVLPILLAIIFPAWLVPFLAKKILRRRKKLPSFLIFTVFLVFFAFLANLFWKIGLFNRVYYEWDSFLPPYTFFWHESPSTANPNWLAEGWTKNGLYILWIIITIGIYFLSAFIAYYRHRKHQEISQYIKILVVSVISLIILTIISPIFIGRAMSNLNYKEVNTECFKSDTDKSKILYSGINGEWTTDIFGKNQNPAFDKNLQLSGFSSNKVSPNGAVAIISWGNDYWFYCTNSNGAFRTTPPIFDQDVGHNLPRSFPSWSPDGNNLIMNNNGDLTLIDLEEKTTTVLKSQVALRDNKINLLAKDKSNSPYGNPFTAGDALWSTKDLIYYTSFEGNNVHMHRLDLSNGEDQILLSKENPFSINNESGDGRYLRLTDSQWPSNNSLGKTLNTVLFDTESRKIISEIPSSPKTRIIGSLFSPSGKYIAQSSGGVQISPRLKSSNAIIVSIDGKERFDISSKVIETLGKRGISATSNTTEVVRIIDFYTDNIVLISLEYRGRRDVQIPRKINLIFDFKTGELSILQDYPEEKFDNRKIKERLDPIQFI